MAEVGWLGTSYSHPDTLSPERWQKVGSTREEYLKYYETMVIERSLRDREAPHVGERAPDFEIERLTAMGTRSGQRIRLSSMRGRPVGLVFGSYT